jgi:glycerol-3-phosphate dehydrogenase (NAD(P)+)
MTRNATIIGDGAMATLCSILLHHNGWAVRMYTCFEDYAQQLRDYRENRRYLPDVEIPEDIEIVTNPDVAFEKPDWAVSAVPTQYLRGWMGPLRQHVPEDLPIVSITKGIENDTLLRPTQIISDALHGREEPAEFGSPPIERKRMAVLSGPCIAPEVAEKLPATVVIASDDEALAEDVQQAFSLPWFRAYSSTDRVGVELAAATKNVIAIAAGILDGMKLGDNAKAALLTRGLAEISRLGETLGACPETFAGLAGMGDLVTTCISPHGRNRSFGQRIGEGRSVHQALSATQSVVEGVATTRSVMDLSRRQGVEMPITRAISRVLFDGQDVQQAIHDLMTRPLKAE